MKAYAVASSAGRGHTIRSKVLIDALEGVDGMVGHQPFEALIIDTYDKEMAAIAIDGSDKYRTIYIQIVDHKQGVHFPVDIAVHPSIKAQQPGWKQIVTLNGSIYTLIHSTFRTPLPHNSKSRQVLVIPGSADTEFWKIVNRSELEKQFDVVVCDDKWSRQEIREEADKSLFVCTAGGVVSQEMNALGKWNLVVKTADNQLSNIMGLIMGRAGFVYSLHNIHPVSTFSTNGPAPLCVNPNGASLVATEVAKYLLDFNVHEAKRQELGVGETYERHDFRRGN